MMITKVMAIGTIIRCRIMDMEGTITIGGSTNREITGETTGIIKAMGTIETIEEMTGKGVIGRTKRKVLVLVVIITIREGSITITARTTAADEGIITKGGESAQFPRVLTRIRTSKSARNKSVSISTN